LLWVFKDAESIPDVKFSISGQGNDTIKMAI